MNISKDQLHNSKLSNLLKQMGQIQVCINLAQQLGAKGKYAESLKIAERDLQIALDSLGQNHIKTVELYALVGAAFTETNQYQKSLEMHLKSLKFYQAQKVKNYLQICKEKDSIARVYKLMKKYKQSAKIYRKLLQLERLTLTGHERKQLAITLVNFATLLGAQSQMEEATEHYKQAIKVSEIAIGANNYIAKAAKINIRKIKKQIDFTQRQQYFNFCFNLYHDYDWNNWSLRQSPLTINTRQGKNTWKSAQ